MSRRSLRPVLVYDARCALCRRWVRRLQARTGADVFYVPYQTPLPLELLGVSRFRARESVVLVRSGRIRQGEDAIARVLTRAPGLRWLGWIGLLPPVRPVAEWLYRRVARHRAFFGRVDGWLFGRAEDASRSKLVRWLFLRALGLAYFAAFRSLRVQVLGLYGRGGILPIDEDLRALKAATGETALQLCKQSPSIFWWGASDAALLRACRAGELLSLALIFNVAPRTVLASLWALYLSFVSVGREFLMFQWDTLLLESSLAGPLVVPGGLRPKLGRNEPPWPGVFLLRWLAFRLHFQSGFAKLHSGDSTWRDRTACLYHFETQPLPTPIGWHAHQLRGPLGKSATAAVLFLEVAVPFLAFAPRRPRALGFWLLAGLQSTIALTGNYAFFNWLSTALASWLLDDHSVPRALSRQTHDSWRRSGATCRIVTGALAGFIFAVSALEHVLAFGKPRPPNALRKLLPPLLSVMPYVHRVQSINKYGLFSAMTRKRYEIVIEGSDDGVTFLEYEFRYKPGDLYAPPRWVAPHQPRLDWQMWFAALGPPPVWFARLLVRLLEGSPEVLGLLKRAPFGDRPPRYVRATLYEYRMTDRQLRRQTGAWWQRELLGPYFPEVCLDTYRGARVAD